jgi:hypothetical protein
MQLLSNTYSGKRKETNTMEITQKGVQISQLDEANQTLI